MLVVPYISYFVALALATLAQAQDSSSSQSVPTLFLSSLDPSSPSSSTSSSSSTTTSSSDTTPSPAITSKPQHTDVWIDSLADYSSLPKCAKGRVSDIVRGMKSGCGVKGPVYTSYDCFCSSSSSTMNWIINTAVMQDCSTEPGGESTATAYASSALAVFHSYCEIPVINAATQTAPGAGASAASTSATPGSGSVSAPANTGAPSIGQAPQQGLSSGAIAGIAIGCVIAAALLIAAVVLGLVACRRTQAHRSYEPEMSRPLNSTSMSDRSGFISRTATSNSMAETSRKGSVETTIVPITRNPYPRYQLAEKRMTPMAEADGHLQRMAQRAATPIAEADNSFQRHELPGVRSTGEGSFFVDSKKQKPLPTPPHPALRLPPSRRRMT